MPLPTDAPPAPAQHTAARPRCPRCGARLGRLAAEGPGGGTGGEADAGWYCGCCGLVLPAAAGAAPGER